MTRFNLVLPLRGAFTWHVGSQQTVIDCNAVALLSPETTFRISHALNCGDRCISVHYREDIAYDAFRSNAIGPKHWSLRGETQQQVRRLVYEMLSTGGQLALEETAFALIDLLATSSSTPTVVRRKQRIADQVRERIHQQVGAKDSLQDIAAAVSYSPFHLARCFRAQTGVTIHQYRQDARLALGLERLRFTDEPITEIALNLGFYDHSHFTAAFIRAFGAAPSSVRASARVGPRSRLRT